MGVTTSYLSHAIDIEKLPETIKETVQLLQIKGLQFDAIAFRGSSGMLVGPSVAMAFHKPMLMVRKPNDNSHSWTMVEGELSVNNYIIVDDQISSGRTVFDIVDEISKVSDAKFLGVVTYNNREFLTPKDYKEGYGYDLPNESIDED